MENRDYDLRYIRIITLNHLSHNPFINIYIYVFFNELNLCFIQFDRKMMMGCCSGLNWRIFGGWVWCLERRGLCWRYLGLRGKTI